MQKLIGPILPLPGVSNKGQYTVIVTSTEAVMQHNNDERNTKTTFRASNQQMQYWKAIAQAQGHVYFNDWLRAAAAHMAASAPEALKDKAYSEVRYES